MGDGQVLESGTHDDLLQREGHYHRLVQAQKLRESASTTSDLESEPSDVKHEISIQEDIPLARRNTGRSLASEIIEHKRKDATAAEDVEKDLSLFQLGKRLATLIPDKHMSYYMGTLFALGDQFSHL